MLKKYITKSNGYKALFCVLLFVGGYAVGFKHGAGQVVKTEKVSKTTAKETTVVKKKKKTVVTTEKPDGSKTVTVVEEEIDTKTDKKSGTSSSKKTAKKADLNKYKVGVSAHYDWQSRIIDPAGTFSYRFYGPIWSDFGIHKSKAVSAGISVAF